MSVGSLWNSDIQSEYASKRDLEQMIKGFLRVAKTCCHSVPPQERLVLHVSRSQPALACKWSNSGGGPIACGPMASPQSLEHTDHLNRAAVWQLQQSLPGGDGMISPGCAEEISCPSPIALAQWLDARNAPTGLISTDCKRCWPFHSCNPSCLAAPSCSQSAARRVGFPVKSGSCLAFDGHQSSLMSI